MRAVKFCALAALLVAYASAAPEYVKDFESFKTRFNRKYASPAEEARKFKNFVANMKKAAELQAVNPHATFGANEFADMSEHDFKTRHNGEKAFREARKVAAGLETLKMSAEQIAAAAGQSQDWRPKGAVTPVKNQGQCGSCWSFSTTGGIEGQWFLAGNKLTSLSEQELVSCDTIDSGCNGGLMDNAFEWLINNKNGSIVTEASYPYVSGDGIVPACDLSGKQFGARIESYKNIASSETEMGSFVYTSGPLSIAVDAESWQTYTGGVMTNCPAGQLDHGVLIVGFDDSASPAYWIIKNSWGASWGESGYIRVQKGTGQCSIGQYQTTSIVKKSGPTPPPAPTPAPAGPTTPPSPSTTQFVQKTCLDNKCSSECSEQSFPAGQCVNRGGKSFKSTCATDAVIVAVYASENCAGEAVVTSNPLDTCSIVFEKTGGEHFVENECRSGSNPPSPPSPPSPPAPTPAPTSSATFEQKQCSDSACSQGCTSHTFPQNSCLTLSGGGSATAVCTATELQMTVYPTSNTCSGMSESSSQPINQCLQDQQGTYFENICNNGNAAGKTIEHSNFKGVFPKRA